MDYYAAMFINVLHEVPYAKGRENTCMCGDGDFWGESHCGYIAYRTITHGRKAPPEPNIPVCTLFNKRLELDGFDVLKCSICLNKCIEGACTE